MIDKLDHIGQEALQKITQVASSEALEQIRISVLGKKGKLSEVLRGLKDVGPEERPKVGGVANQWKRKIEEALRSRKDDLDNQELEAKLQNDRLDVTLPSRLSHQGSLHLITQTQRRIVRALSRIGFRVTAGPEIETDHLCFEAANIPKDHPARDMQDTFFIGPNTVLRTHTTPVQMRTMLAQEWPVRVLCPGAVYRKDDDATHSPMFHQVEGLWVDRKVTMADLKGVLDFFAKEIFGPEAKVRFRPSYFPFVEPGVEVDIGWKNARGKSGEMQWLEILGAGMVHPNLFVHAGYDPSEVSGFAFGMGIERIAMLLHQVPDMRLLFKNDVRFLNQF